MVVGSLEVETDVVVIGSGPGGYVAAIRAAQLGNDVMIIEKDNKVGGVCLNDGCIPTKALISSSSYFFNLSNVDEMGISVDNYSLDMSKMISWKDKMIKTLDKGVSSLLKSNGVEVLQGEARFVDKNKISVSGQSDVETIIFKKAIIATGSTPVEIDGFSFDGNKVITSAEALRLEEVPKRLVIIGGGYIGTEIGTIYGKLGSKVDILEAGERLLPQFDKDISDVVAKDIGKFSVECHYGAKASGVTLKDDGVEVEFSTADKESEKILADKVMVAVGRSPNTKNIGLENVGVEVNDKGFINVDSQLRTNVENIFAIGDVAGEPMLAHKASHEGVIAAEAASGENSHNDNKVVPMVVFNDPDMVSVGMNEEQAKEKGYEVVVDSFPLAALGRARTLNDTRGFVKMIADKKTNVVLGFQGAGQHMSEIVGEVTLAIEMGAKVEDLALTIHPHPTMSESIKELAHVVLNQGIHIYKPKK